MNYEMKWIIMHKCTEMYSNVLQTTQVHWRVPVLFRYCKSDKAPIKFPLFAPQLWNPGLYSVVVMLVLFSMMKGDGHSRAVVWNWLLILLLIVQSLNIFVMLHINLSLLGSWSDPLFIQMYMETFLWGSLPYLWTAFRLNYNHISSFAASRPSTSFSRPCNHSSLS